MAVRAGLGFGRVHRFAVIAKNVKYLRHWRQPHGPWPASTNSKGRRTLARAIHVCRRHPKPSGGPSRKCDGLQWTLHVLARRGSFHGSLKILKKHNAYLVAYIILVHDMYYMCRHCQWQGFVEASEGPKSFLCKCGYTETLRP